MKPTIPTGIIPTKIFCHSLKASERRFLFKDPTVEALLKLVENRFFLNFGIGSGKSLLNYNTMTANIEPNWITTRNRLKKSAFFNASDFKRLFNNIICPVELTGSHSVTPCTIP